MLKLDRVLCEIRTFAPFSSRKGQCGVVIKFEMSTGPEVLDQLMQGLSAALYKRPDVISAQSDATQSPARFPQIRGLDIDYMIAGAAVEIDREDLLGECRMRYTDCEVTKVRPVLEDGACSWTFLVKIGDPAPEDVGKLYQLLKKIVVLTMVPPEAATYEQRDDATGDMFAGDQPETHDVVAGIWERQDRDAAEAAAQAEAEGEPAPKKRGRKAAGGAVH